MKESRQVRRANERAARKAGGKQGTRYGVTNTILGYHGKYLTHEGLKKANDAAIETKKNRSIREEYIDSLSEHSKFPITLQGVHNGKEMRIQLVMNEKGDRTYLDLDFDMFDEVVNLNGDEVDPKLVDAGRITQVEIRVS